MSGILKGYKTYTTAGLAAIAAITAYLLGEVSLIDTVQMVVTAALGATLRSGIAGMGR